ncbi:MAG TPA: class I SAM-dependent methyltransferase [Bryobacteraceae bacterium]|nr:class I SAM-dependent methyltransferase [Bryobacteraceae bacterium]
MGTNQPHLQTEFEHHEALYSGPAQELFRKPAVRALRQHMVRRILSKCHVPKTARVLSIGCGIGDTEICLAPHVREIVGIDISPSGIRQARLDATSAGLTNVDFRVGSLGDIEGEFDLIIAIFFLHHLPDRLLETFSKTAHHLSRGGCFYSLDPSRYRLSGMLGRLLVPRLMKKYQTEGEMPLDPQQTVESARAAGLAAEVSMYDMFSSPFAGLLPDQGWLYEASRVMDDMLVALPGVSKLGSNFEVVARRLAPR